jgi:hypothetical protein
MSTESISYRADSQLTFTLASLASSSTLVAGRESTSYDNSSNKDTDAMLSGKVTTGTGPSAGTVEIWVIAPIEDTPAWPDVFDGTDSTETVTSRDILAAFGRLAASITIDSTSDRTYPFNAGSIAALFGGVLPSKFVIFITQSSGVNFNATGSNHQVSVQGITRTIA